MEPNFKTLVKFNRSGLYEQEHNGLIVLLNKERILCKIGSDNDYPFYQRSCMKPLQAAVLLDYDVDKEFNLSFEEIAIASASHVGDKEHTEVVKGLLNKIGLDEFYLKCGTHKPLSVKEQERLVSESKPYTVLHNNCSGKHAAMLALCLKMGWDLSNYLDDMHLLNTCIVKKVLELCEFKEEKAFLSKDGCGLPTVATTLSSMGKGFLNLFLNDKYLKIKNAFVNHPYLIGGHDRLDSEVINCSEGNLIAKVGAGGLCTVVNLDLQECLVVKIADADMKARGLVVINSLIQLGWLKEEKIKAANIGSLYNINISTIKGEVIGGVEFCFSL